MKTKSIVLSLALAFSVVAVSAAPKVKPSKSLSSTITSQLITSDIDFAKYDGETINIRFQLNDNNEIEVISTNHTELDSELKETLNNEVVKGDDLRKNTVYKVNVTFNAIRV